MQLKYLLLLGAIVSFAQVIAQKDSVRKIDANFLFNYYEQDGNHSAVTGGKGTQQLEDVSSKIQMVIDLDSGDKLFTSIALNRYSSASTDRIDSRMSSASAIDYHLELEVGYEKPTNKKLSQGGSFYGAVESDYISMGLGYFLKRKKVKNGNYGLNIKGFYDSWILIYPEELRKETFRMAPTDKRYTLNVSQTYGWNLNRKMKAGLSMDITYQYGMLGTPFHRVYFSDTNEHAIEQLPKNRIKIPLGFQWNWFLADRIILKSNARLYVDNFGINALTIQLQPVFLLSNTITFSPFVRYHDQSAASFFSGYAQNQISDEYYTSDYDLSTIQTLKYGAQLKIRPFFGILGKHRMGWESIGFRYSRYERSDGLEAYTLGFACGFVW